MKQKVNGKCLAGRVFWLKGAVLGFGMVAEGWFGEFGGEVIFMGCTQGWCYGGGGGGGGYVTS